MEDQLSHVLLHHQRGLSGISGLSFDSPFLSPLLFFCPVLLLFLCYHFLANGPFSGLGSGKLSNRLFCVALVEQLGDDSWSVVCEACCHLALVFAIICI